MSLYKSISGTIRVEATSASVADMLTAINNAGITLNDVIPINDLKVEATVSREQYSFFEKIIRKRGETVKVVGKRGVVWPLIALKKRPVFVIGLIIYFLLAAYLPTRILFVEVKGNHSVQTQDILDVAAQIGVSIGASRRQVRSEVVKNALLKEIPQLQWVGVNTYGCVAVISVEERTEELKIKENKSINSIVAKCDGVIQEITVTRGSPQCVVGQAVTKGQVLVSGYTDCGIIIKATSAEAEVYANTLHQLEAVSPTSRDYRAETKGSKRRYCLILGKKLIKLFKDSGISDTSCVKMYEEFYLTLPGGFRLPVGLAREELIQYEQVTVCSEETQKYAWLQTLCDDYVKSQMIAGRIIDRNVTLTPIDDRMCVYANYACYEMIGQVYNEEIYRANE